MAHSVPSVALFDHFRHFDLRSLVRVTRSSLRYTPVRFGTTHWLLPTSMQIQLPSSSVVEHATLLRDTRVAAAPSLKPELVMNTRPASWGFSNFFRVCLGGGGVVENEGGGAGDTSTRFRPNTAPILDKSSPNTMLSMPLISH